MFHPVRGCAFAASLLVVFTAVGALRTLDSLKPISSYADTISNNQLKGSLAVSTSILQRHNKHLDSQPLQQYINQLEQVLQQECCDYFQAVPIVRQLTENLDEVLDLKLPQQLLPALRRSYVSAIWLMQRSRLFRWNTKNMHKLAMHGFLRLYEAHIDVSAGRPISFHHISKSGGTSLCQLARQNGCKGPVMNRADNCLLNKGMDGPTWVLKHDVLLDNGIPVPPPPPPPPPATPPPPPVSHKTKAAKGTAHTVSSDNDEGANRWADDDDDDDNDDDSNSHGHNDMFPDPMDDIWNMDNVKHEALKPQSLESLEWFMYDCDKMLKEKEGYGCTERQEVAAEKSATFFANEHTLSFQHGEAQVCPAFTNLVMVREPLSEAVSLMGEVIQVYYRVLRRRFVDSWQPPRWDLTWWQHWAPVVVSSYATRTLLGPHAFCPPRDLSGVSNTSKLVLLSSGKGAILLPPGYVNPASQWATEDWLMLSHGAIDTALEKLYSFDAVLELGSPQLVDISTSKLLGWSSEQFSTQTRQRNAVPSRVLSWQELEFLAAQTPPQNRTVYDTAHHMHLASIGLGLSHHQGKSSNQQTVSIDAAKRMLAEVWIQKAYQDAGELYVITPLLPGHKRQQMPSEPAVKAAQQALQLINQTTVTMFGNSSAGGHVVVRVDLQARATTAVSRPNGTGSHTANSSLPAAKAVGGGTAGSRIQFYHIWPKHGVVLDEQQYRLLLRMTAADQQVHQHAQLLHLLDAAWLSAVSKLRAFSSLLKDIQGEGDDSPGCGFAGLNHLQ